MTVAAPDYGFYTELARILNSGQSRSVLLYGNVNDLFYSAAAPNTAVQASGPAGLPANTSAGDYVPLLNFLTDRCRVPGMTVLVYELNGPIRLVDPQQRGKLRDAWCAWRMGRDVDEMMLAAVADKKRKAELDIYQSEFDGNLASSTGQPTVALEFLRQLSICSRSKTPTGKAYLTDTLLMIIEAADLVLPAGKGDIADLAPVDRHRVAITQDWFSDPGFLAGRDSVIMIAESQSQVHPRVARLPSLLTVEVSSPNGASRQHFIEWFAANNSDSWPTPELWGTVEELANFAAGLSIHAMRQMLIGASFAKTKLLPEVVVSKVEQFIQSQLGDDVVEFKKPSHTLDDVIGFSHLKQFLQDELLPRFRSSGGDALPGAAVAGPIGGGKTFIFEAVASSLGLPVLVLKNIRSQWYGQTDVIFERLRRVLEALVKVVIFVDEADTQFGGVGPDAHETERRLTGKIQQMMSDPRLRGRIVWLLMTARIHLLSPDIRRPGRVGDLIIPVLDPEGEDRLAFVKWTLAPALPGPLDEATVEMFNKLTAKYSAAAFAALRSQLKARAAKSPLSLEQVEAIIHDHLPPAIEAARKYQTLQALINCTRRSLLPDPNVTEETRARWEQEIAHMEAMGVR